MSSEWSYHLLPGDSTDDEIGEFVAGIMADDDDEGEGDATLAGETPRECALQSGASR